MIYLRDTEMKGNFACDYMYGAHPKVMEALVKTNMCSTPGYGEDEYCQRAKQLIKKVCDTPDHEVYFLTGGTQTNAAVIDALLSQTQGVIAAESSHINVHESGAIEATGHKVLTIPAHEGKISAEDIDRYVTDFYADDTWQHMMEPGMVYITFPSEYGTLYTRGELTAIQEVCRKHNLPLYIDGARLGYGLVASTDLTIRDIAEICDIFYIGGTKQGTLIGEAVVAKKGLLKRFFSLTKQHGALLAKGRILGVQFEALFTDGLYFEISRLAVNFAQRIRCAFAEAGYPAVVDSPTNQQFFRLPNDFIDRLLEEFTFEYWGPRGDTHSTVRFVTSWATTEEEISNLENSLRPPSGLRGSHRKRKKPHGNKFF